MAKNDHAHAVRMMNSLKRYAGEAEAADFAERLPLSKSAGIEKNMNGRRRSASILRSALRRIPFKCSEGSAAAAMEKALRKG